MANEITPVVTSGKGVIVEKRSFKPNDGDRTFYSVIIACAGASQKISIEDADAWGKWSEGDYVSFDLVTIDGKQKPRSLELQSAPRVAKAA